MKKLLIILICLVGLQFALLAESYPIRRLLQWDASEKTFDYQVLQDCTIVGNTTKTEMVVTIPKSGSHTFIVIARSESGDSVPATHTIVAGRATSKNPIKITQ